MHLLVDALPQSVLLILLTSYLMSSAKPNLKMTGKPKPEIVENISVIGDIRDAVALLSLAKGEPDYKSGGELPALAESLELFASRFTPSGDIDDRFAGVSRIGCKLIHSREHGPARGVGGVA